MKRVVIDVVDSMAELFEADPGIDVLIRDYDAQPSDPDDLERDDDGRNYVGHAYPGRLDTLSPLNDDGDPVPGKSMPVTFSYGETFIRVIFGDAHDGPDLYIDAEPGRLRVKLHPDESDPTLYLERFEDGRVRLTSDAGLDITIDRYGAPL